MLSRPCRTAALSACFLLAASPALAKTVLPDACGNVKDEFDVKTQTVETPLVTPQAGKALIVFVLNMDRHGSIHFGSETVRFGIDGKWAGADHGNSYFTIEVDPGVHHLCTNWQGKKQASALSLTAEAGKTYIYQAQIYERTQTVTAGSGTHHSTHSSTDRNFDFSLMDEDEGKFLVKASKLSTFGPHKPYTDTP